jgi:hypothetical protein
MGFQFFPPPDPRHLSQDAWQTACLVSAWPAAARLGKHRGKARRAVRASRARFADRLMRFPLIYGLHLFAEMRTIPAAPEEPSNEIAG